MHLLPEPVKSVFLLLLFALSSHQIGDLNALHAFYLAPKVKVAVMKLVLIHISVGKQLLDELFVALENVLRTLVVGIFELVENDLAAAAREVNPFPVVFFTEIVPIPQF